MSVIVVQSVNREGWLTEVAKQLEPMFKKNFYKLPEYRVTCGWPCRNALGSRQRRVGECHAFQSSKAGVTEVFISPTLDKPLDVAGTLCHEMIHVAVGVPAGHKGKFRIACKRLGLVGKPTQAMPGPRLNDTIQALLDKLGPYPHSALQPTGKLVKSKSGNIRLVCECGCKAYISPKWLEEAGIPTCGCGSQMEINK